MPTMRRSYGGLAMLLALVPAAMIAVPAVSAPMAPTDRAALVGTDFDAFNAVTFNEVDGSGFDVPRTTAATLQASFDTSGYGLQDGENEAAPNYNGCSEQPPVFAGRTAWVRFTPGVAGTLFVGAITSSYDSVLMVRRGLALPLGASGQFSVLSGAQDCSDANNGAGNEGIGNFPVVASATYYVQVGPKCTDGRPCTAPGLGGPTTVQLTFVPADTDGDGVVDTNDVCPSVAGQASAQGCPDGDGDGIRNDNGADNCPSQAGVPAPAPYNGCPAGPTPPSAESFVRIVALDGDLDNSNDISVSLSLSWPKGAQQMTIDNGDGQFQTFDVASTLAWQLRPLSGSAASESRQVTVTFRGPFIVDTFRTDSITLDTRPPGVPQQRLYSYGKGWFTAAQAKDGGTGISRISFLGKTGKQLSDDVVCAKTTCPNAAMTNFFTKGARPRFVRAVDAAGNAKSVKLVRRLFDCSSEHYAVFRKKTLGYRCFEEGDECKRPPFLWKISPDLKCVPDGSTYRVKKRT